MTKRLIDLDDDLLAAAQQATGEQTIKGTVTEALRLLVTQRRQREADIRDRWNALDDVLVDLQDDGVMGGAWS